MTKNILLIVAGISTLFQACIQLVLTATALAQYFCLVDLLQELPLLLYLRILYFHNPTCSSRVAIGHAIEGMADQAFVLITTESLPTFKTFLINSVFIILSVLWIFASGILIHGGAKNHNSVHYRWPWMSVMVLVFGMDVTASVSYITDTFHTRTLTELVGFVRGVLSGAAGQNADTSLASWLMVMMYSRFGVTILFNVFLVICVLVDSGSPPDTGSDTDEESIKHLEDSQAKLESRLPRVSILRRVPTWISARRPTSKLYQQNSTNYEDVKLRSQPATSEDSKQSVNFPENLLSLPQRLENMIVEQQRRLDASVVDTSGRASPQYPAHTHPNGNHDGKGRRNTAAELQGQLPWSYILPNTHYMRSQLPPEEDLPPVPVPDYTLPQKYRKASVHQTAPTVTTTQGNLSKDLSIGSPVARHDPQTLIMDVNSSFMRSRL